VPGFFFNLGGMEKGKTETQVAGHHTPDFYIDESGMKLGVKAFCFVVLDYLK
jgi:metal-dependent amidase/aminoacylase/carboxypeptidase family protein